MPSEDPCPIVVILVHGTWGRRSKWTDPASPFCLGLGSAIGLLVTFKGFAWSGKNSGAARLVAAEGLAQAIVAQIELQPDAKVFVIGHSHGGNVALKAAQIAKLEGRVGVVCMSTPFFDITPRYFGAPKELNILSECFLALIGMLVMIVLVKKVGWFSLHRLTAFFVAVIVASSTLWPFSKLKRAAVSSAENLSVSASPKLDLMIVRATGDEAAIAIGSFQLIGILINTLIRRYVAFVTKLDQTGRSPQRVGTIKKKFASLTPIFLTILVSAGVILHYLKPDLGPLGIYRAGLILNPLNLAFIWYGMPFILLLLWLIGMFTLSLLVPLMIPVALLACVPLGLDFLLLVFLYDVNVEAAPPGDWVVSQIVPAATIGLKHSFLYGDPVTTERIGAWIRTKVERA